MSMREKANYKNVATRVLLALCLLVLATSAGFAQDDTNTTPVISAENIGRLESVVTVDFEDLPDDIGAVDSGWFTLAENGAYIAVIRQDGGLVVFDAQGNLTDTYTITGDNGQPGTVLDAAFGVDNQTLAALHTDGEAYYVSVRAIGQEAITRIPLEVSPHMPVRIWLDETLEYVWLEVLPGDAETDHFVRRIALPDAEDDTPITLPSGPENDQDAFARIGRIPAPLAITSTQDGLVKLWDLETGEVISDVRLEGVPVFGRVNETTGRQLAWRDPESQTLNLLDFTTGENEIIASLGGEYIQAILLSPAADVILGVAIGDEPIVAAWDVSTGEYHQLGEYRPCSRVPDMVRLSKDGTTLVIGCDTGLDIWRVTE